MVAASQMEQQLGDTACQLPVETMVVSTVGALATMP